VGGQYYIQWRYVGDSAWINLYKINDLIGPTGAPGPTGASGANGREIELKTSNEFIEWRYVGDATWYHLYDLIELVGPPGADSTVPGPPGADSTVPGPQGPPGPGVWFTYHTFAIKGVIPSDTFFPGFIINKAGESNHTQTIEKISARTRSGSCQFVVYKRGAGSSTDNPILPNSSGSFITAIALGANSTTGCPYNLTDNDYIFIKTLTSSSTTDLSVTITIKHVA
jgi:hypothetical protein